jgi:hypothetical protein
MQCEGNRVEMSLTPVGTRFPESRFTNQFHPGAITMKSSLVALIDASAVTSSAFGFDFPPITPPHSAA